jgi:hypothetical protein
MNRALPRALCCATVLVAVLVSSCGSDDDDSPADVAEEYTRAGERGDAKAQCELVSKERLAEYGGREACEAENDHGPVPSEAPLESRNVTESGDTAKLLLVNGAEGGPRSSAEFELVREDGAWKVRRVGTLRSLPEG